MKFVIYSHSSFADILELQEERLQSLLIDYAVIIDDEFDYKGRASQVITYKNDEPFATRLYNSAKQISDDYILLMHEVDLLIDINAGFLEHLAKIMVENRIDKIDLQQCPPHHSPQALSRVSENVFIGRSHYPHDKYVYNVQPTLWKRESLIRALENYRDHTYRSIEYSEIQQFCSERLMCYRTVSADPLSMGYFSSTREFVFLHLTHFHHLLPIDESVNKMCKLGNDYYRSLMPRLQKSGRLFRETMY